ncbi:CFI-box-CTERM domain-containing protein [Acidobacteriota bacterium]
MKGKIFSLIVLLNVVSSLSLNAQWARTYGGGEDDYASSIQQTYDGGYIVAGTTESFGAGYEDFQIFKLASDGTIEWQKTFGGDLWDFANSIRQTSDGGYILGGTSGIYNKGDFILVLKISSNGDIEWKHYYEDPNREDLGIQQHGAELRSVQQTNDGGYIAACSAYLLERDKYDIWILKLFPNGEVEWNRAYRGSLDDRAHSMLQTNDGGYIVAGYTNSSTAGGNDIWILKLASDGNIEWQKTFGESQTELAYSIKQTNDGGYIVVGHSNSRTAGNGDIWILKLSSSGDIEWNKAYGGIKNDTAHSIQQTFDGGYIVAGKTYSFGAGIGDVWILKLNILGAIEWQKTYGGGQDEEAKSIQQTSDGGYIVAGSTESYGVGKRDFLILKLFSNGDMDFSCGLMNESNAEVSDTSIIFADTDLDPEDIVLVSKDASIIYQESEAVDYSLCSGEQHTLIISASSGGTTNPQPGTYIYDYAERISIDTFRDEGYNFFGWSGDVLSTDSSLSLTMDSNKSIKANFIENVIEKLFEDAKETPCFIATAAFGSPLHPYVRTLQDFRDKYLMTSRAGRNLVNLYNKYSPHIAELITNHKVLRSAVRIWLVPIVAMGYSMVHFGPSKTTMMFVISIMPLFFFVWFYRRRSKQD